jgi:AsmA protein
MESNKGSFGARWNAQALLRKTWVKVVGGVLVAFLLVVVIVPMFVNVDAFRPEIEQKISAALGRPVTLGHLSFSLLTGSLVAADVAIADDPAFSSSPFFEAKTMRIGVSTGALIFEHQLHISKFTADAPQIQLISRSDGTWNYASLGGGTAGAGSQSSSSSASGVSIGELNIRNGSVHVSSIPSTGRTFVYDRVNVTVKNLSFATSMPFELTANLPGSGSVKLTGTAGPLAQPNTMNTPLQATMEVKHFDPVAAGVVAPSDGITMLADLNAQINSDGKTLTTTGKLTAANLKLSPQGSPAPQPVTADLSSTANVAERSGQINDLAVHTGAVAAHVNGTYQLTGATVTLNLHLSAPGVPVDGLEQLLPAVGVRLPSGSKLEGGTLTANMAITGTPATLRIEGPVEIENTRLAGFSLAQKIPGLSSSGSGNGTEIRKLTANVVKTPQATELSQIDAEVPSLGAATGSGTVSASGALDFQLQAKLGSSSVAGGVLRTATGNGIPLTIGGTTADPSFHLDMGSMMKQQAGRLVGAGTSAKNGVMGAARGLLHK